MASSERPGDQLPERDAPAGRHRDSQPPVMSDEELAAQEELDELDRQHAETREPQVVTGELVQVDTPSEAQPPLEGTAAVSYPIKATDETGADDGRKVTRAGMVWAGTIAALILLVLLIIFIAQNQEVVTLRYFGLVGQFNLGLALLLAAVGGGILAAIAAGVRIIQLQAIIRRKAKNRR